MVVISPHAPIRRSLIPHPRGPRCVRLPLVTLALHRLQARNGQQPHERCSPGTAEAIDTVAPRAPAFKAGKDFSQAVNKSRG